jgi:hypothetical protein
LRAAFIFGRPACPGIGIAPPEMVLHGFVKATLLDFLTA